MAAFEEGLGRIMCVVGALEHERPFLRPLFKFMTMHPRNAVRRIFAICGFHIALLGGADPDATTLGVWHVLFNGQLCAEGRRTGERRSSWTGWMVPDERKRWEYQCLGLPMVLNEGDRDGLFVGV